MAEDRRAYLAGLVNDCVHCGFCLPACPTYELWGEEMDSPRGRIHLIGQVLGGAPLEGAPATHFDRCLSCMACVSACPSGVRYDELIEATRAEVESRVRRPFSERVSRAAIFFLFPYPNRLRIARLGLGAAQASGIRALLGADPIARRLPRLVKAMESVAPPITPLQTLPRRMAAKGERRGVVGMLTGCVQSVFFSQVNLSTARVLCAEGFDVVIPKQQRCCGALSWHAGREHEARRLAKATVDAFESLDIDYLVVNAAGCGSAMKDYSRLFSGEAGYAQRVERLVAITRDLSELLAAVGPRAQRHPLNVKIAYQDACHLAHAQRIRVAPRDLLDAIPGVDLAEIDDGGLCCGSAGIYNLVQTEPARQLGDRKAKGVIATGAKLLVSANPGCMMQIRAALDRAGAPIRTAHIAEVLDASIQGRSIEGIG